MNAVDTSSALQDLTARITTALIDLRQQRRSTGNDLTPQEEIETARETARRFAVCSRVRFETLQNHSTRRLSPSHGIV